MEPRRAPAVRSPLGPRIVMSLLVFAALGGLVWVATAPQSSDNPTLPAAVELVSPQGGDLDLRQATIAADLAPGYTGYLLFDGVEVPDDDLQRVDALNTVTLRPTVDSDYLELTPGPHCATVVYRKIGEPMETSNNFRWCFELH
ncbi:MAG: hypothetical protein ACR2HV_05310 [Acidimicrobiales bacterium]